MEMVKTKEWPQEHEIPEIPADSEPVQTDPADSDWVEGLR